WTSAVRKENPTAKKVLSLHQHDMIAAEVDSEGQKLFLVVKFRQSGQIILAEHHEAGNLKQRDGLPREIDPFKYFYASADSLKRIRARQVRVDELGRVFDPGPRS